MSVGVGDLGARQATLHGLVSKHLLPGVCHFTAAIVAIASGAAC